MNFPAAMKAFRNLYRANLTEFLSNRRALFLTIAFPVLFITIFGLVFTNQDKADARIGVACVTPDDPVARAILKALQEVGHRDMNGDGVIDQKDADKNPFSELRFVAGDEAAMLADLRKGRIDAVITIPADLGPQAADAKVRALKAAAEEQREMDDMADLMDDDDKADKSLAQTGACRLCRPARSDGHAAPSRPRSRTSTSPPRNWFSPSTRRARRSSPSCKASSATSSTASTPTSPASPACSIWKPGPPRRARSARSITCCPASWR